MALIRFGRGSELYIYQSGDIYICCNCVRKQATLSFDTKEQLKAHILLHKEANDTVGLVGNELHFQSYDELLQAIDLDYF
jgi:hypothetical protein